jgi:hypothetical protein
VIDELAISKVLARYVRCADIRDGVAVAKLFTTDSLTEIFENYDGKRAKVAELQGSIGVEQAFGTLMQPHPKGGWSHHVTADHIIDIDGDHATLNAQFIMFRIRANEQTDPLKPRSGKITPEESGYYDADLQKINGEWKFTHHRVIMDFLPSPELRNEA